MTEIHKKIATLKDNKQICCFYITVNDIEKSVFGYVLDYSKSFLLIRECLDFYVEGLIVIPINKITKLRQAKIEKNFTKIYKLEKLDNDALIFEKITLESYPEIFKAIKKKHKFAIIENVFDGEIDFCIGEIIRINKTSVSILYFDITGKIDKTATTVLFKDIANIEFDSNYINTFIRHLK